VKKNRDNWTEQGRTRTEAFTHLQLIKLLGREDYFITKYLEKRKGFANFGKYINILAVRHRGKKNAYSEGSQLILLITVGLLTFTGGINLATVYVVWYLVARLFWAVSGLSNAKQIIINGFITGEGGLKMSKTLGNVVNPIEVINEYGTDALRYFMLREINPFEDSPFTMDKFKEAYNAHLANGLGNLVSRVMKMVVDNGIKIEYKNIDIRLESDYEKYIQSFDLFEINKACDIIWNIVQKADKRIQIEQPFKLIKTEKEKGEKVIKELSIELYKIAILLQPLLPSTSDKIKDIVENTKMPESPLFIRK
jgi:leucyl-tRNA synthetase